MKIYPEQLSARYTVNIVDYEIGDYLYRILVPMRLTKNLGPDSEYEPLDPVLYGIVSGVMKELFPGRQFEPGGWDIRDRKELEQCLSLLRSRIPD